MRQGVVACIGTADGDTRNSDGLVLSYCFVGESRRGISGIQRNTVAALDANKCGGGSLQQCSCSGGSVIFAINCSDSVHCERAGCDVGRQSRLGECVVAHIRASNCDSGDGDGLVDANSLGSKCCCKSTGVHCDVVAALHSVNLRT